ncbi:MAG: hypothetical protein K0S93_174 [Nitrososphaeraceae archaeon]|jgi:hypothetical protein|nr:hypothetical protein [Nitrososphaeraceae archaeon]
MGNWNFEGHKLTKCLKPETIKRGGLQQITTPILECKVSSELEEMTIQMGGYRTFINYNKHREKQHKKAKQQKRFRTLNKQIKRFSCRNTGLDFPDPDLRLDKEGGHTKK